MARINQEQAEIQGTLANCVNSYVYLSSKSSLAKFWEDTKQVYVDEGYFTVLGRENAPYRTLYMGQNFWNGSPELDENSNLLQNDFLR